MEKIVDGITMEIPDHATRETLLQRSQRPADSTVYAITPDGEHRVLNPGESVADAPGDRLGIIGRFRTGKMVSVDGINMEVPDDATRAILLRESHCPPDRTVYWITDEGEHRVMGHGESLTDAGSDRFGTVSRLRTGMIDADRIRAEIKLLEQLYGRNRVVWAPDHSWIMITDWKLPPNYNASKVNIIILVPDQYGYGTCYSDSFVPAGLRLRRNGGWVVPPHYFEEYSFLRSEFVKELQRNRWSYLSVHPANWSSSNNITTYLTQVYTFLSNPFDDWDR